MAGAFDQAHDAADPGCTCGCCAGIGSVTPQRRSNAPGQPMVRYRVGRHAEFRASMLARLSSSEHPALARLTTRDSDDFGIALCDAAATVLDVLAFYQERLANESYLRTAGERRSIVELAQLIGYRPAAGLAASTWLAFSVQAAPGQPGQPIAPAPVPTGARVQSVPGAGEDPQSFETVAPIEARVEWNAMPVQSSIAWIPARGDTGLWLDGLSTGLATGDALLIVGEERLRDPGAEQWDVRVLAEVVPEPARGRTRVRWDDPLGNPLPSMTPAQQAPRVYALRQRAGLFGHGAPDPRLMSIDGHSALASLVEGTGAALNWKDYRIDPRAIDLDAAYAKVPAGSWFALVSNAPGEGSPALPGYVELYRASSVSTVSRRDFGLSAKVTRLVPDTTENLTADRFTLRRTLVLAQSERLPVVARPLDYPVFGMDLTLDSRHPDLGPGRVLALTGPRQRLVVADRAQGLLLEPDGAAAVALVARDPLVLMGPPLLLAGGSAQPLTPEAFGAALGTARRLRLSVRDRDGTVGRLDVRGRDVRLAPPLDADETCAEIVFIADGAGSLVHGREATRARLAASTQHVFDRGALRVNANVAPATHGEAVVETLGSGVAGQPDQRFALRQQPLTQVGAATPAGRASTLELRVNDLRWEERATLFGAAADARVYTTVVDEAGRTQVVFGDGIEGARPPSGQDNIRARYRKGLGAGGNLAGGRLTSLLTRPLGIAGVVNPVPATGGQDAETLDGARANAPLTVLTLDRAVSVRDYQDFARSFGGIAKAHATAIAAGPGRGVFVTVAGSGGAAVDAAGAIAINLLAALRRYGDALLPLRVASFRPVRLRVRATLVVAPDADASRVIGQAHAALAAAFAFAERGFGQTVSVDEVDAVLHRVEGIVAVNVIELYRPDQGATPRLEPRLFARLPEASLEALPLPAELLSLDPADITIEEGG